MKKFLFTLAFLLMCSKSEAQWSFVGSGGNGNTASGTTLTFTISGVSIGDLVVVTAKWETTDTTISVSDTASTFVDALVGVHKVDAGGAATTILYTLASATSGVVTYTVTWGVAKTFRDIGGMAYTPPSLPSLDGTAVSTIGSSTACSSGNITTTSVDGLGFGYYGETGGVPNVATASINGVVNEQIVTFGSNARGELWSRSYSAGFTGAATMTIVSNPWSCGVVAFKPSGVVASPRRMRFFGIGP